MPEIVNRREREKKKVDEKNVEQRQVDKNGSMNWTFTTMKICLYFQRKLKENYFRFKTFVRRFSLKLVH